MDDFFQSTLDCLKNVCVGNSPVCPFELEQCLLQTTQQGPVPMVTVLCPRLKHWPSVPSWWSSQHAPLPQMCKQGCGRVLTARVTGCLTEQNVVSVPSSENLSSAGAHSCLSHCRGALSAKNPLSWHNSSAHVMVCSCIRLPRTVPAICPDRRVYYGQSQSNLTRSCLRPALVWFVKPCEPDSIGGKKLLPSELKLGDEYTVKGSQPGTTAQLT